MIRPLSYGQTICEGECFKLPLPALATPTPRYRVFHGQFQTARRYPKGSGNMESLAREKSQRENSPFRWKRPWMKKNWEFFR